MTTEEVLALASQVFGRTYDTPHFMLVPPVTIAHRETGRLVKVTLVGKDGGRLAGKVLCEGWDSSWKGISSSWVSVAEFDPLSP